MNMLKFNKVSLVDNQFTDEELKTGGLCTLNAGEASGKEVGKGVWHFVKDGTATCVAAETDIAALPAEASCKVEELVLKLTKKVHREIPVAADQTTIDTGLKGLNGSIATSSADAKAIAAAAIVVDAASLHVATVASVKDGVLTLEAGAKAGVLVVDLKVAVGEGKASHPSIDAAHKLELKEGEPLHVVLYANAKNLEGAKLNVTDFHTRSSRIGITK